MRAFVITIDGLVALSFIFIAMLLLSSQTFQPSAPRGVYLKQLTLDALTLLEKTDRLAFAVEGDTDGINELLQDLPELACMQMTVTDSHGEQIVNVHRIGCGEHGRELQSAAKPFTHDGERYMVKATAWYGKIS